MQLGFFAIWPQYFMSVDGEKHKAHFICTLYAEIAAQNRRLQEMCAGVC